MAHIIEQAFGTKDLDLYGDVLKVGKACSLVQLRKAYYKQALVYHPDKNTSTDAKLKFQAISWTYQLLKHPERRAEYDRDGTLPFDDEGGSSDEGKQWKAYFDTIFGKVSASKIDNFAAKYKMSEEEEKDVLLNYEKFKGNLSKMLEYVVLSEERDVQRWVEDYIKPAIKSGEISDYSNVLNRTLAKIESNLGKKKNSYEDPDETESENSDDDVQQIKKKNVTKRGGKCPKKVKSTKAGKSSNAPRSNSDLVEAIRSKRGRTDIFASLSARYGIAEVEDPLDDETFARLQSKRRRGP